MGMGPNFGPWRKAENAPSCYALRQKFPTLCRNLFLFCAFKFYQPAKSTVPTHCGCSSPCSKYEWVTLVWPKRSRAKRTSFLMFGTTDWYSPIVGFMQRSLPFFQEKNCIYRKIKVKTLFIFKSIPKPWGRLHCRYMYGPEKLHFLSYICPLKYTTTDTSIAGTSRLLYSVWNKLINSCTMIRHQLFACRVIFHVFVVLLAFFSKQTLFFPKKFFQDN